jgi:hypothetical protein
MALWEYKVITSGKGGFASATMLESYLNQLGKDEWEIIDFRADPTNALAFTGLARRPTQREWTLEAAVAAAAKVEADKLRAELMQKQHAGDASASAETQGGGATAGEKAGGPDSLRQLRDTDRDHDPEALAEEASQPGENWDNLDAFEDDLPTFFDAIKPHLRKNQNAPGQSVALNYLAKRWEQAEEDLHGALRECGFTIPEVETEAPVYLDYEGDLYWVEKNNRGQFFLNTREKPRPKFRIVPGKPLDPSDPAYAALAEEQAALEAERTKRAAEQAAREAEAQARRAEREAQRLAAEQARREQQAAAQAARAAAAQAAAERVGDVTSGENTASSSAPAEEMAPSRGPVPEPGVLPEGPALLDAIRPQMRRNRRGPGYSGSSAYLAKYFRVDEGTLRAALAGLGLVPPATPAEKSPLVVIGAHAYWVNKDNNGGLWINGREAGRDVGAAAAVQPLATAEAQAIDHAEPAPQPGIFRAVPRSMPPVPATGEASAPDPQPDAAGASPAGESSTPAPETSERGDEEESAASADDAGAAPEGSDPASPLAALRLVMKPNRGKTGLSVSIGALAEAVKRTEADVLEVLRGQGLVPPPIQVEGEEEPKPVFLEHGEEIYWLSRFAKDGSLWLNAKLSRAATRKGGGRPSPRPRTKRRASSAIEADTAAEE